MNWHNIIYSDKIKYGIKLVTKYQFINTKMSTNGYKISRYMHYVHNYYFGHIGNNLYPSIINYYPIKFPTTANTETNDKIN